MQKWMCITCGTWYPASQEPPADCLICNEERQYVRHGGQVWTTLPEMQQKGYRNEIFEEEPGLYGIRTVPSIGIGQWGRLLRLPEGNILWECLSYLDDETERQIRELGGIRAIALSHPHYYSAIGEWAERFDAQIFLPEADRQWVVSPSPRISYFSGDRLDLWDGVSVLCVGGHFPGSSVLHWAGGAGGKGVLLAGDTIMVVQDRNWLSFMYSYPNLIPLPAAEVERIAAAVAPYAFDRIYSAWERVLMSGAKDAMRRSVARYIEALKQPLHQRQGGPGW